MIPRAGAYNENQATSQSCKYFIELHNRQTIRLLLRSRDCDNELELRQA